MRLIRTAVTVGVLAAVTALPGPAFGAADGSGYAQWRLSGGSGSLAVPLAGFPSASVTTSGSRSQVAGGTFAFLDPSTPFAHAYGSSQGKQYLVLGGSSRSVTTVSFSAPPPSGWGFALGDVDGVRVTATDAHGQPVTASDLGWQGAFNYCRNVPPACPGPATALPRWRPGIATLIGEAAAGESGWFRPAVPLRSVTLTEQVGGPGYRLWLAARPVSISGRVGADCGRAATAVTVRLLDTLGFPIQGLDGDPVTTTSAADGTYSINGLAAGRYQLAAGPDARTTVDADTDVSDAALTLPCPAEPISGPIAAADDPEHVSGSATRR